MRTGTDADVIHYPNDFYTLDTGPQVPTRHVFLNGKDIVTITGATSSDTTTYNFADALNSVTVTADKNNRVQEVTDYMPYGALNNHDQLAGFNEQRKYIGQPLDADTNLNYLNARYYNPAQGQFLSEDPVSVALGDKSKIKSLIRLDMTERLNDPQQLNSYNYSQDNPIVHEDPTGLDDGFSNFFNSYYPNTPPEVVQYMQQLKAQAIETIVMVPLGAQMGAGVLSSGFAAPEVIPEYAEAYQGALLNIALRATNDAQSGAISTPKQYFGTAAFGTVTTIALSRQGLLLTMAGTAFSSLTENNFLDGSREPAQVTSNSIGAGVGLLASDAASAILLH